jgi:hypothetical protein
MAWESGRTAEHCVYDPENISVISSIYGRSHTRGGFVTENFLFRVPETGNTQ